MFTYGNYVSGLTTIDTCNITQIDQLLQDIHTQHQTNEN